MTRYHFGCGWTSVPPNWWVAELIALTGGYISGHTARYHTVQVRPTKGQLRRIKRTMHRTANAQRDAAHASNR